MSNFFFINRKNIQKNNFQFDSDESHHLINVMRLKIGSEIHFTDGEGGAYIGLVSSFDNDIVSGNILNVYKNKNELKYHLHLGLPLIKKSRIKIAIEKSVESGVKEITPLSLERSIKQNISLKRLNSISKSAVKQSMRSIIPTINPMSSLLEWYNPNALNIACFIGAEGIGGQVWQAIRRLDVGWAMEGGLCILFMAIMFDRFSLAFSKDVERLPSDVQRFYLLPQSWEKYQIAKILEMPLSFGNKILKIICQTVTSAIAIVFRVLVSIFNKSTAENIGEFISKRYYVITYFLVLFLIAFIDHYFLEIGTFPKEWKLSIRQPITNAVESLTVNPGFISFAKGLRAFVYLNLLRPLDVFLTQIPWWYTLAVFSALGYVTVGIRFAIITAVLLLFIGACGIWTQSMITLSSVLVSVVLCFVIGVPLGIIASYNERFRNIQNVVLDAMQTLPYFCYLIPVLMFFGGGTVSAVLATVIYSIPPIIRLTSLGLTQVSGTYSEVSRSFGGTLIQTLNKVKFPLAIPSLVIGFNQTVIMAFAMQIVTPLIGGKGLGLEVFNGLARSDTGRGLAAGIGIVLLAIIIDRITLAWTKKQREALGLIS